MRGRRTPLCTRRGRSGGRIRRGGDLARCKAGLLGAVAAAGLLAGCTSAAAPAPTTNTRTVVDTVTATASPGRFTPAPATTVAPLPRSGRAPKGERFARCPYIRSGLDEDPTDKPNVADIQGNRIGHTTVITGLKPVGCRFWFAYDTHAVADILPRTFPTAAAARLAMVRTAQAGNHVMGVPGFVKGVDGISYRTRFYGPDGTKDWAFVFAKGRVMVVVHTEETTTSHNALYLAQAIAGKF